MTQQIEKAFYFLHKRIEYINWYIWSLYFYCICIRLRILQIGYCYCSLERLRMPFVVETPIFSNAILPLSDFVSLMITYHLYSVKWIKASTSHPIYYLLYFALGKVSTAANLSLQRVSFFEQTNGNRSYISFLQRTTSEESQR